MAEKKTLTDKESAKKIKDLKIELLKNPTKKASIKKEIARLLTMENMAKLNGGKKNDIHFISKKNLNYYKGD